MSVVPAALRRPVVVAVDGPSGSGKSSVSREVARRLGLAYLDTGAMYRAVCWACHDRGVDLEDTAGVAELARGLDLVMETDPAAPRVWVGETEVTAAIRDTVISSTVSRVATNLDVRAELRARQRDIVDVERAGPRGGCVVEGRDITTVVAPDADVRVLLTAAESTRLARRAREVHGSDDTSALEATRDQVVRRDADDATVAAFHSAADGVQLIDSTGWSFDETVDALLAHVLSATGEPSTADERLVEVDLASVEVGGPGSGTSRGGAR